MKVYRKLSDFNKLENSVVTSGTFDGVHIAHQKILQRLVELARKAGGESVVVTFWPHPRFVLDKNDNSLKLLSTFEEKTAFIEKMGVDHLVRIEFTQEFSQLSSDEFIRKILVDKIGTKKLIIGYDHRFGKNREGSFEYLAENAQQYGFSVEEIPRQVVDDTAVSSTKIRKALLKGEVETALEFLGRPYSITGKVVAGAQVGKDLGFPTANIQVKEEYKLIPEDGTYAVHVFHQSKQYNGMLNIGYRPTVNGSSKTIEVNIFNFSKNIYGHQLRVHFIKRIRSEKKFSDLKALKIQLDHDRKEAIHILKDFYR